MIWNCNSAVVVGFELLKRLGLSKVGVGLIFVVIMVPGLVEWAFLSSSSAMVIGKIESTKTGKAQGHVQYKLHIIQPTRMDY